MTQTANINIKDTDNQIIKTITKNKVTSMIKRRPNIDRNPSTIYQMEKVTKLTPLKEWKWTYKVKTRKIKDEDI